MPRTDQLRMGDLVAFQKEYMSEPQVGRVARIGCFVFWVDLGTSHISIDPKKDWTRRYDEQFKRLCPIRFKYYSSGSRTAFENEDDD